MNYDALKKRIQENLKATETALSLKDLNECYRAELDGGKLALEHVLTIIESLEKEKPIQLHSLECDCWSGRSEAEIRERIDSTGDKLKLAFEHNRMRIIDALHTEKVILEWVLTSEKKECPLHTNDEISSGECAEFEKKFGHKVSSAPKIVIDRAVNITKNPDALFDVALSDEEWNKKYPSAPKKKIVRRKTNDSLHC